MIVEGWDMHLYCDGAGPHRYGEGKGQFAEASKRRAHREARRSGWKLTRSGHAYCPKCKVIRNNPKDPDSGPA
jgi:hypothetical protein